MSSILDALEKLEARRRTQTSGPEPPPRARRRRTPLLAGAAVAAFAAGIGSALVWLRAVPSVPAAPAPAVSAPPAAAPPPTTPPAQAVEQPWAEVVIPPTPHGAEGDAAPEGTVVARTPARERGAGSRGARAPRADAEPAPPPATAPAAAPAPPAGAPSVRVSFLVYSSVPERRSVALTIDDAGLVTLHEGEDSAGLSVAQILPDGVELTWQGRSFTIPARN